MIEHLLHRNSQRVFVVAGLLFALNKKFLPDVIAAMQSLDGADAGIPDHIYHELFVAQKGFCAKVGAALKDATMFWLLPHRSTISAPHHTRRSKINGSKLGGGSDCPL